MSTDNTQSNESGLRLATAPMAYMEAITQSSLRPVKFKLYDLLSNPGTAEAKETATAVLSHVVQHHVCDGPRPHDGGPRSVTSVSIEEHRAIAEQHGLLPLLDRLTQIARGSGVVPVHSGFAGLSLVGNNTTYVVVFCSVGPEPSSVDLGHPL